jgi:hypothetical protein
VQILLCTWNGATHYPGTRHNYKIKDTKIAEIHKPEGSAPLTPHPPLQRNILLSHFTFPLSLSVLSPNSLSHVRSCYAVFSPICCMRLSVTQPWYGQSHLRMYPGRVTHSKVPTTAVSPFPSSTWSQRNILSLKRCAVFCLRRWTMSKMSVTACGPIYSQDSTKPTILKQVAEALLLFIVKSERVWNGIITRIFWIYFTAFNRKLTNKQKNYAISLHFSTTNCICKEK